MDKSLQRPAPSSRIVAKYCGLGNMNTPPLHVLSFSTSLYRGLFELPSLKGFYSHLNFDQLAVLANQLNYSRRNPNEAPIDFSLIEDPKAIGAFFRSLLTKGYTSEVLRNIGHARAVMPDEYARLNPLPEKGLEERLADIEPEKVVQLTAELKKELKRYCESYAEYDHARRFILEDGGNQSAIGEKLAYLDFLDRLPSNPRWDVKTRAFSAEIRKLLKEYPREYALPEIPANPQPTHKREQDEQWWNK